MILLIINDKLRPFITSPIGALDGPVPLWPPVASAVNVASAEAGNGAVTVTYGDLMGIEPEMSG